MASCVVAIAEPSNRCLALCVGALTGPWTAASVRTSEHGAQALNPLTEQQSSLGRRIVSFVPNAT